MYSAKVICDSISKEGIRLTTMELSYPRFIHSQFMTHRMFSRSCSSSRAIPIEKMIGQVLDNPALPVSWGENKPGMQAEIQLDSWGVSTCKNIWNNASLNAVRSTKHLAEQGLHKQVANRLLEPFQYIKVVVTATEWDNFFRLRLDHATQPEMQMLAESMKTELDSSVPNEVCTKEPISWHLPYIGIVDIAKYEIGTLTNTDLKNISAARCARVSYLNHDNTSPDSGKDLDLASLLRKEWHMSPFEHQGVPMRRNIDNTSPVHWELGVTHMDKGNNLWSNNFRGWIQYRALLEG